MRETTLYEPIKRFLENQGYEVKAEVGVADVVTVRGDESPVIVELKTAFSLSLFHQATERQTITDSVYIAVPASQGRGFRGALRKNLTLCRRFGLGLITVCLRISSSLCMLTQLPIGRVNQNGRKTGSLGSSPGGSEIRMWAAQRVGGS